MSETYYRKVGRRYKPVLEYDSDLMSSLPEGAHLIVVTPGCQSTYHRVNPDHAPILAALRMHREAVLEAARRECPTTSSRPLTKAELAGLAAYQKATGNECLLLSKPSAMAMVEALERAVLSKEERP